MIVAGMGCPLAMAIRRGHWAAGMTDFATDADDLRFLCAGGGYFGECVE